MNKEALNKTMSEDDDEKLYSYLLQTRPDGNVMLTDDEQKELMERLEARIESEGN
jgi:hypothetical protein